MEKLYIQILIFTLNCKPEETDTTEMGGLSQWIGVVDLRLIIETNL
jgi:hypothetical protein